MATMNITITLRKRWCYYPMLLVAALSTLVTIAAERITKWACNKMFECEAK